MKKYGNSLSMVISLVFLLKFAIRTWFCNCPKYLCLFRIFLWVHLKYTWSKKDVGSPKSTSLLSSFHIGLMDCFFPANLMSSTYTDKNNPFSRCVSITNLKLSPNFVEAGFSQIAFPMIVLLKRMTLQLSLKRNEWVFHVGPWFRPLVSC